VVRSDNLPQDLVAMERVLGGVRVVLCTLSMLSNSRVMAAGLARLVPIQTVVVDEASQIEAGDYLPLVGRFASTLKKIVCIGDDKQRECSGGFVRGLEPDGTWTVPPYGQEDVPELQSVFELKHLKRNEVFLDTQCMLCSVRMV
jgi:superfamily I DNA and/or RNA helicase